MALWPTQIETVTSENWYNGQGLSQRLGPLDDPDPVAWMWQTISAPQGYEQWDNVERDLIAAGTLDGSVVGDLNPADQLSYGYDDDGFVYVPTETPFPTFLKKFVRYPADLSGTGTALASEGDPEMLTNFTNVRCLRLASGAQFIVMPSYSTGQDGLIWDVDGAALTFLDCSNGTPGINAQIKGFIYEAPSTIWALLVNGDVPTDEVGFWEVVDGTGVILDGAYHQVAVTAVQGSLSGLAYGFAAGGALFVLAGHGVNQYLCRIETSGWTETDAVDVTDLSVDGAPWLIELTPDEGEYVFIGNEKRSTADLSILVSYPYSLWDINPALVVTSVRDVRNNALFATLTQASDQIAWLFFPGPPDKWNVSFNMKLIPRS
jgi:hypothetical protein